MFQFSNIEDSEASKEVSNKGRKADESASDEVEPPNKRRKVDDSATDHRLSSSAPNKFLSSLEKKANTQEATWLKINNTLASHITHNAAKTRGGK